MLGQMESSNAIVIADMEAGIGILSRMSEASFDLGVIVTDSSVKAIEVARRAREIITERKLGPIVIVANRVRDGQDVELIGAGLGIDRDTLVVIPEDEVLMRSDRDGVSPLDQPEVSAAVAAIGRFAGTLSSR
ncbi:MAG: hypothetical protein NVS1B3_03120 [Candidatus Dormibacteraceae bacterium]